MNRLILDRHGKDGEESQLATRDFSIGSKRQRLSSMSLHFAPVSLRAVVSSAFRSKARMFVSPVYGFQPW